MVRAIVCMHASLMLLISASSRRFQSTVCRIVAPFTPYLRAARLLQSAVPPLVPVLGSQTMEFRHRLALVDAVISDGGVYAHGFHVRARLSTQTLVPGVSAQFPQRHLVLPVAHIVADVVSWARRRRLLLWLGSYLKMHLWDLHLWGWQLGNRLLPEGSSGGNTGAADGGGGSSNHARRDGSAPGTACLSWGSV